MTKKPQTSFCARLRSKYHVIHLWIAVWLAVIWDDIKSMWSNAGDAK